MAARALSSQLSHPIREFHLYFLLLDTISLNMDWDNNSDGSHEDYYRNSSEEDSYESGAYEEDYSLDSYDSEEGDRRAKLKRETELDSERTSTEVFDMTEENTICQICWKYAVNAVLCSKSKCQKLFCEECITNIRRKQDHKCPFCQADPFLSRNSPHRDLINQIEQQCAFCKEKYQVCQEGLHFKSQCSFFQTIPCLFCEVKLTKKALIDHTKQEHKDRFMEMIELLYANPVPVLETVKVLESKKLYLQKISRVPRIGTTGKFYCSGKLETKCTCCNGYCGPTNGENCVECMKLDIIRFGLAKGQLVNAGGRACWKNGESFVCGVRINLLGINCCQENPCKMCSNLNKTMKRYEQLLL